MIGHELPCHDQHGQLCLHLSIAIFIRHLDIEVDIPIFTWGLLRSNAVAYVLVANLSWPKTRLTGFAPRACERPTRVVRRTDTRDLETGIWTTMRREGQRGWGSAAGGTKARVNWQSSQKVDCESILLASIRASMTKPGLGTASSAKSAPSSPWRSYSTPLL